MRQNSIELRFAGWKNGAAEMPVSSERLSWYVVFVIASALVAVPTSAPACECESLAADQRTVERVQSSWMSGYASTQAGDYAKALRALRTTAAFLPLIRDDKTRECVAAGANNLIGSAVAGETYLSHHPRDVAGARGAAQRAWRVFLNCQ